MIIYLRCDVLLCKKYPRIRGAFIHFLVGGLGFLIIPQIITGIIFHFIGWKV